MNNAKLILCLINSILRNTLFLIKFLILVAGTTAQGQSSASIAESVLRQRISINDNWYFYKYKSAAQADNLIYDVRPEIGESRDDGPADAKPTEAVGVKITQEILKPWILPAGNDFIKDPAKHYIRPDGNPGSNFPFVQADFDDSSWELVDLPHDWAIKGRFYEGRGAEVGGGMGRLPSPGEAWYRKRLCSCKPGPRL